MTDKLQIELVGGEAMMTAINEAIGQLAHPRELMESIGAQLAGNVEQRFKTKTDASGQPWKPLSPNTPLIYEAIHGKPLGGSLLERSGHMRDALTYNASDEAMEIGFGGSAPYAVYHVTGTRKMPRRDPLFGLVNLDVSQGEMGAQDQRDVLEVVDNFLDALLG